MRSEKKKAPFIFQIGVLLLFLSLVSTVLISGLYARYSAVTTSFDEARVAEFDVDIEADVDIYSSLVPLGELQPGGERTISFTVNNHSEVSVFLTVGIVNLTGNLPIDLPLAGTVEAGIPAFEKKLAPAESVTFSVTVSWDEAENDPSAAGKTDVVEIQVSAEQVD